MHIPFSPNQTCAQKRTSRIACSFEYAKYVPIKNCESYNSFTILSKDPDYFFLDI